MGGNGYDPRWCAGLEPIQKQKGEQEWSEVVHSERVLQPVGGRVSVCPKSADVVDQRVQPRVGAQDGGGKPPDLGLRQDCIDEGQ